MSIIKDHWKLPYLRKALSQTVACSWLGRFPGEYVDGMLVGPASLAQWISTQDTLLQKPSIGIFVLGSHLDVSDSGAWWSPLAAMLGKPASWARIRISDVMGDQVDTRDGKLPIPSQAVAHIEVMKNDVRVMSTVDPDSVDIIFVPLNDGFTLGHLLTRDNYNIWPLLNHGSHFLVGLRNEMDLEIHREIADACGLVTTHISNKYNDSQRDELGLGVAYLASCHGKQPDDLEMVMERIEDFLEMGEVIADLCYDVTPVSLSEEYRMWGMEVLLKSSIGQDDHYITLPRQHALRKRTGRIYRVEDSLAIGDPIPGVVDASAIAAYPGGEAHWIDRAVWASRLWRGGVADEVNSSYGSVLEEAGFSDMTGSLESLFKSAGLPDEQASLLMNALTGGERYTPRIEERKAFDLIREGNEEAVISYLEENPSLVDAKNEQQHPILTVLGKAGMAKAMQHLLGMGANPHVRDGGYRPAIVELAISGTPACLQVLLDYGADPDSQDYLGWTPILTAVMNSRWENANLLLDRGANPGIRNSAGESARMLAQGIRPEIFEGMDNVMAMAKNHLDFDLGQALARKGVIFKAEDIPEAIRQRLK